MQTIPGFSDSDRFGLALFGSALVHMVIILGVSFMAPKISLRGVDTLEITLVQTRSEKAPAHAQFLAQVNQDGGGDTQTRQTARSPLPALEMSEKSTYLPIAQPAPQMQIQSIKQLLAVLADEEAAKLVKELMEIPMMSDANAVKIADVLPTHADDVRAIFAKERFALTKEDMDRVLEIVRQYL